MTGVQTCALPIYHQAMESADRLITEAMSADKNFELQLLQIQQQLDVALTS